MTPSNRKIPRERRREEALRPSPVLGYDHDALAQHLLSVRALSLAESELRRAIWLNPYEPLFLEHLALCLFEEEEYEESLQLLDELQGSQFHPERVRPLAETVRARLAARSGPPPGLKDPPPGAG